MKKISTLVFISLILPILLIAQVDNGDDTSLKRGDQHSYQINATTPSDVGPLLTNGVLVTTFSDVPGNLHPMGIVFDGTYYWRVGGGGSPGLVSQLDASFNLVASQNVDLDCRGIFYNPADGEVYIKGFTNNGLYRLHTNPFTGGFDVVYTSFFQNAQSKACMSFLDGTKMYDHLDGTVNEYDFATGTLLNTISLSLQHDLTWPRGNLIAHSGTYLPMHITWCMLMILPPAILPLPARWQHNHHHMNGQCHIRMECSLYRTTLKPRGMCGQLIRESRLNSLHLKPCQLMMKFS